MKFRGKMTPSWVDESNWPSTSASSNSQTGVHHSTYHSSSRHGNVFRLLAWREISPRKNLKSRKFWEGASKLNDKCIWMKSGLFDSMNNLLSWVEAESLQHLSAKYCPLVPPPRSTIAASFSSDGKTLASTHGDHTVKIIDCQTGRCLKVLNGHRRTPWVVRFHPIHHEILASGSLDHEVRLWDANSANCIGFRDFHRPISSIAFHPQGDILAVASGHKLYIWHYSRRGETSSPTIVLKTRRSLRAVHFHPNGAPLLLTAEVNDLDSPDCPMTLVTSTGYLRYPPPTVLFMNADASSRPSWEAKVPLMPLPCFFCPTFIKDNERTLQVPSNMATSSRTGQYMPDYPANHLQTSTNGCLQDDYGISPMEMSPMMQLGPNHALVDTNAMDTADSNDRQPTSSIQPRHSTTERLRDANYTLPPVFGANEVTSQASIRQSRLGIDITHALYSSYRDSDPQSTSRNLEVGPLHQFFAFADPAYWELPFMQGWLMGQSHAALHTSTNNSLQGNSFRGQGTRASIVPSDLVSNGVDIPLTPNSGVQSRIPRRSSSQNRPHARLMGAGRASDGSSFINISNDETESQANVSTLETEIVTSLAAAAAAELPCTVKLRIWPHNEQNPCAPLDADTCRLVIPHAVLCSEMGAHFSPCGRFLAACIACVLPHMDVDAGLQSHMHHDVTPLSTSPTRHPISGHQIVYELRIFSLEKSTFGMVLASHAIRAAHCLTSIQFSPTSEHILLAYGRRHNSLLRSIVIDGESAIPVYTILEVYRVSDMELVRVLPSAEDEVNVACFRPLVGGGIVYGTKEGKLRLLHYDGSNGANTTGLDVFLEENALEDHLHAL